jgi:hypothetical protein
MRNFDTELIKSASFKPFPFENNSAWRGHLPFAAWLTRVFKPAVIVELGSHWGHSYFTFCQAVSDANLPTSCYAVDTWQGDEHAGNYGDEVFAYVDAHNKECYAKFSHLLRMTFDDALNKIPDGTVELLHIDGLHTYEAVKHDFETWKVKLAPGAVVLFHDTYVREREFGVWQLWEELQALYPNNLAFTHSYGLGVLQIEGASDEKKMTWLDSNNQSKQDLKDYFSALGARLIEQFELGVTSLHAKNLSIELASMTLHAKNLGVELGWRDQWVLDREQQLDHLTQELTQRSNELGLQIKQSDALGLQVQQIDAQLKSVYDSTSWRITRPMRIIRRVGGLLITGNLG